MRTARVPHPFHRFCRSSAASCAHARGREASLVGGGGTGGGGFAGRVRRRKDRGGSPAPSLCRLQGIPPPTLSAACSAPQCHRLHPALGSRPVRTSHSPLNAQCVHVLLLSGRRLVVCTPLRPPLPKWQGVRGGGGAVVAHEASLCLYVAIAAVARLPRRLPGLSCFFPFSLCACVCVPLLTVALSHAFRLVARFTFAKPSPGDFLSLLSPALFYLSLISHPHSLVAPRYAHFACVCPPLGCPPCRRRVPLA